MTELKRLHTNILKERHERFLRENKDHLNAGRFDKYQFNCQRIARIIIELNRRESLKQQRERP